MSGSIHNSVGEMEVTPQLIESLGARRENFHASDGGFLPYQIAALHQDLPGENALLVFLHGVGSVGEDNFLQMRIAGPPILRYCREKQLKIVVLYPQCAKGFQWVDVPWNSTSHDLPVTPSIYMSRLLELFDEQRKKYGVSPKRTYAGGISMGGYGAWDLVSRRSDQFAGMLNICGGADIRQAVHLQHLKTYMIHGGQDPAVPVTRARDMAEALMKSGNKQVRYRELPGVGHNAWDPCFADNQALGYLLN